VISILFISLLDACFIYVLFFYGITGKGYIVIKTFLQNQTAQKHWHTIPLGWFCLLYDTFLWTYWIGSFI